MTLTPRVKQPVPLSQVAVDPPNGTAPRSSSTPAVAGEDNFTILLQRMEKLSKETNAKIGDSINTITSESKRQTDEIRCVLSDSIAAVDSKVLRISQVVDAQGNSVLANSTAITQLKDSIQDTNMRIDTTQMGLQTTESDLTRLSMRNNDFEAAIEAKLKSLTDSNLESMSKIETVQKMLEDGLKDVAPEDAARVLNIATPIQLPSETTTDTESMRRIVELERSASSEHRASMIQNALLAAQMQVRQEDVEASLHEVVLTGLPECSVNTIPDVVRSCFGMDLARIYEENVSNVRFIQVRNALPKAVLVCSSPQGANKVIATTKKFLMQNSSVDNRLNKISITNLMVGSVATLRIALLNKGKALLESKPDIFKKMRVQLNYFSKKLELNVQVNREAMPGGNRHPWSDAVPIAIPYVDIQPDSLKFREIRNRAPQRGQQGQQARNQHQQQRAATSHERGQAHPQQPQPSPTPASAPLPAHNPTLPLDPAPASTPTPAMTQPHTQPQQHQSQSQDQTLPPLQPQPQPAAAPVLPASQQPQPSQVVTQTDLSRNQEAAPDSNQTTMPPPRTPRRGRPSKQAGPIMREPGTTPTASAATDGDVSDAATDEDISNETTKRVASVRATDLDKESKKKLRKSRSVKESPRPPGRRGSRGSTPTTAPNVHNVSDEDTEPDVREDEDGEGAAGVSKKAM